MRIEGVLPDELVDTLPEPRRTLHRRAVDVIERHQRDRAPYVLVLRNYGVVQLFGGTSERLGDVFENVLIDALEQVLRAQGRRDDARRALRMAEVAAERGSYGWCADVARERAAELG